MIFEIQTPENISFEVVTPDREHDFFIDTPPPVLFDVDAGVADSGVDLSLIYQIALL